MKLVSVLVLTLIAGAFGSLTVPVTMTLVEMVSLANVTVLLLKPNGAAPVRRTKTAVFVTAPLELVSSVRVFVKSKLLVEMAKLTGSFAVTVMLLERLDPLAVKLLLIPGAP